jgi:RNA recognition motif-containing protein
MTSTKLFIGNIPYTATEQDLRDLFGRGGGKVASVRVITDFDTGRSKGYAFVEMSTPDEAQRAMQDLHNFNMNGRTIVVNEARPRQATGGGGGRAFRSERAR